MKTILPRRIRLQARNVLAILLATVLGLATLSLGPVASAATAVDAQTVRAAAERASIRLDPCAGTTTNREGQQNYPPVVTIAPGGTADAALRAGKTVFQYENRGNLVFRDGDIIPNEAGAGGLPYCSSRIDADGTVVNEWAFCTDQHLAGCANKPGTPESEWGSDRPTQELTPDERAQIAYLLAEPDLSTKRSRALLQTQIWCISEGFSPGTVQRSAQNYFNSHQLLQNSADPNNRWLSEEDARCADVPVLPVTPTLTLQGPTQPLDVGDLARFTLATNLTTPITLTGAPMQLCPSVQPGVTLSNNVITLSQAGNATLCATSASHGPLNITADSGGIGLLGSLAMAWSLDRSCQAFISYRAGSVARLTPSATADFVGYGSFQITKKMDYEGTLTPGDLDDVLIEVAYEVVGSVPPGSVPSGVLNLNPTNGFSAHGPRYPVGTQIRLTEHLDDSGLPPSLKWEGAQWSVDGTVVPDAPTLTIGDNTSIQVVLTNTVIDQLGTFEVIKHFVDTTIPLDGVEVTVAWQAAGRQGEILLNQANGFRGHPGTGSTVELFPIGTRVELTESSVTGLPAGTEFAPDWGSNTIPGSNPPRGEVTIAEVWDDTNPITASEISLTNGLDDFRGSLRVTKALNPSEPGQTLGEGALDDVMIQVNATWPGGSNVLLLTEENGWSAGLGYDLAPGTEVTLQESLIFSSDPAVAWGEYPEWSCDPTSTCRTNADGTITVTIGEGTDAAVRMTNTATILRGTFRVEKALDGDLEITDPRLAETRYIVDWTSSDPRHPAGSLSLDAANSWRAGPTDAEGTVIRFPRGTVVTLTESANTSNDPGLAWRDHEWSIGEMGDGSAQIVIVEVDDPVTLTLTNTVELDEGAFTIEKLVHSLGALPIEDTDFIVHYTDGDQIEGELRVRAGEQTSSPAFPTGTVLTLSEAAPGAIAGKPGEWAEPVFVLEDGTRVSGSLEVTIGAGQNVRVELENTFTEPPPENPPTIPPTEPPVPGDTPPPPGHTPPGPPTLSATGAEGLVPSLLLAALLLGLGGLLRVRAQSRIPARD
ncbi:DUF5979 domain-containing protein [Mycetocola saprophilus]|uniref:DUF5979 domain-containing protein n=1 Tax=Mycetocola saprophilus TaxID=76636 RepID=UPI003BF3C608